MPHVSPGVILQFVCSKFHVSRPELLAKKRLRVFVEARNAATLLLHEDARYSFSQISRLLGQENPTAAFHAYWRTIKLMKEGGEFNRLIEEIRVLCRTYYENRNRDLLLRGRARKSVSPLIPTAEISFETILAAVCKELGLEKKDAMGFPTGKWKRVPVATKILILLAHIDLRAPANRLGAIAWRFRRDKTTILRAIFAMRSERISDPLLRETIEKIRSTYLPQPPATTPPDEPQPQTD